MSSSEPPPASTSKDTSRGDLPEIEPVPPTPFEDLCLSRPGGLPIIKGLGPTDAVVFYYGEYQPESDKRKGSRSRSVDVGLRLVDGASGSKAWLEDPGTEAKDKQPATPSIVSKPPQAMYDIVTLDEITSAASSRPAHTVQIPYIRTFAPENIEKLFNPSSAVQYSPELFKADGEDQFIYAVRVCAEKGSHNIFVRLPYLGRDLETDDNSGGIENGLRLWRYRGSNGSAEGPDCGMRVWQSWQILFDNTRLALIKSPKSPSPECAPLFGHQPNFGPLHALALIIGNLFRHEVEPLEVLRAKVDEEISNIETRMSEYVSLEPDELTKDARSDYRGAIKDSNVRLERHISNTKTITVTLGQQLSILRDLRTITTNQQNPPHWPSFGNPVPLPQFKGQSEQLKKALAVFKQLIAERERVLAEMNTLLGVMKNLGGELRGELRMVREQLHEEGKQNCLANQVPGEGETPGGLDNTPALLGTIVEANTTPTLQETTVAMKNIMAKQGQTISCFAFITAIFLPLEFFAQYLSLTGIRSHREFWMIAGPITVFVMLMLFGFMFWEDKYIKKGIAKPWQWIKKKLGIRGEVADDIEKGARPEQDGDSSISSPTNPAPPERGTGSSSSAGTGMNVSSDTELGGGSANSHSQPKVPETSFNQ